MHVLSRSASDLLMHSTWHADKHCKNMTCLKLQVVIALTDDIELSLAGKAQGYWRHDALLGVKGKTGVLPLPPHIHHVVGLRCVATQVQRHLGLVDTAVFWAELDFHQAPCILQSVADQAEHLSQQNREEV